MSPHIKAVREIVLFLNERISQAGRPYIITISGESGCGKTETGKALAGILLGFMADRLGRKVTIVMGLVIGIFKTGALALIGDISRSATGHTSTMNAVEGFFGVGSIAGIILFFTAAGAALGPLSMGAVSDIFGHNMKNGFILATVFAGIFFVGAILNFGLNPCESRLKKLEESEYES